MAQFEVIRTDDKQEPVAGITVFTHGGQWMAIH
jgi:hypothetical protein